MIARLLLAMMLLSAPAWAGGPEMLLAVTGRVPDWTVADQINGISAISSAGTVDTGTQYGVTGAGPVSVIAECTAVYGSSYVQLVVDGTAWATLTCPADTTQPPTELSYTVAAGPHRIRVNGYTTPAEGTFSAGSFNVPLP